MTALRDTAKAKLNLTLEVLGRRADGYHEVRSLVGFTALGDSLELVPGDGPRARRRGTVRRRAARRQSGDRGSGGRQGQGFPASRSAASS